MTSRRTSKQILVWLRCVVSLYQQCSTYLHQRIWNKVHACRSSATQIPTVNRSFFTQWSCGILYPSMCANCHLTASRLVWAPSSSSIVSGRIFIILHMQALFLSGFGSSCYYCTVRLSRHATVLCLWCDIVQY